MVRSRNSCSKTKRSFFSIACACFTRNCQSSRSVRDAPGLFCQGCARSVPPLAGMGPRISTFCTQTVREGTEEGSRVARKQMGESGRVLSDRVGTFQMRSGQVGRLAMLAQDADP